MQVGGLQYHVRILRGISGLGETNMAVGWVVCTHSSLVRQSALFTQGQTAKEDVSHRAKEYGQEGERKKRRSAKQEMRCEGNAGTATAILLYTLQRLIAYGHFHRTRTEAYHHHLPQSIAHPTSPHQTRPHLGAAIVRLCFSPIRSLRLHSVIWWLLHLLVLACISSRAISLELDFWGTRSCITPISKVPPRKNLLRIVSRVLENKFSLL